MNNSEILCYRIFPKNKIAEIEKIDFAFLKLEYDKNFNPFECNYREFVFLLCFAKNYRIENDICIYAESIVIQEELNYEMLSELSYPSEFGKIIFKLENGKIIDFTANLPGYILDELIEKRVNAYQIVIKKKEIADCISRLAVYHKKNENENKNAIASNNAIDWSTIQPNYSVDHYVLQEINESIYNSPFLERNRTIKNKIFGIIDDKKGEIISFAIFAIIHFQLKHVFGKNYISHLFR